MSCELWMLPKPLLKQFLKIFQMLLLHLSSFRIPYQFRSMLTGMPPVSVPSSPDSRPVEWPRFFFSFLRRSSTNRSAAGWTFRPARPADQIFSYTPYCSVLLSAASSVPPAASVPSVTASAPSVAASSPSSVMTELSSTNFRAFSISR